MNKVAIKTPSQIHHSARSLYRRGNPIFVAMQVLRPFICPFGELIDEVPEGAKVVDIGCGGGLFLGLLALEKRIDSGIGVDVSRPAIAAALEMKKNHPRGASIDFKHLSEIDALPEGEFDVVSMVDVLHHIPPDEREKAIVQACSGVRPGGILLYKDMVTRPRWRSWANAFHDLIISAELTTTQDVKAVVSWCANAGLEAEKILTRNMLWYGHEMVVFRKRDGK